MSWTRGRGRYNYYLRINMESIAKAIIAELVDNELATEADWELEGEDLIISGRADAHTENGIAEQHWKTPRNTNLKCQIPLTKRTFQESSKKPWTRLQVRKSTRR